MTSTNITWLYRASVAVAAACAALAVWSWLPTSTGDGTTALVSFWLVVPVILPGMIMSIRRQPNRNSPLAMWFHVRWFLSGAPRWAVVVWFLALAGTLLTMVTGVKPGTPDPAGFARMFAMMAFYFAVTGVLTYRALAREQHA
ncbi:hypothetical protein [Catellatospora chokoriensis]|uniref:Uncharacterized protein n=1 Tax=Catellatospora chokoriensis TaxID=310353 RepID=A0A8J3NT27_9ACTN|nr:hypothetical protein [Catellatospora chokoriensis]GIF91256.1 hypothetical protein Cch02nite_47000 [Catellatospora chokoriensis]